MVHAMRISDHRKGSQALDRGSHPGAQAAACGTLVLFIAFGLGSEALYARDFLPVVVGLESRNQFLERMAPEYAATEFVNHSWYEYSGGDQNGKHPYQGETNPKYTGPKPPFEHLQTDEKYSWLKAPRYQDHPMEVGPLSRMLVAYASGHQEVKDLVNGALAIATARGLSDVAPYFIDADEGANPAALPVGGQTVIAFPNNHLTYALTWFGLALTLAGATIYAAREEWRLRSGR